MTANKTEWQTFNVLATKERVICEYENKLFPPEGFSYCCVAESDGWRNIGAKPNHQQRRIIADLKALKTAKVAFMPFCWKKHPESVSDSDIYSHAPCIH